MANEVIQYDFETNKTIIRDFTSEEKILHEAKIKENESIIEAKKTKESNRTSGINKLKALGLTDDEINELIGMT